MAIFRTPDKLVLYAHVPRCGGTSVEEHIRSRVGAPAFLDSNFRRFAGKRWTKTSPQHATARDIGDLFPNGFFDHMFAVVRHPEDRFLSAFVFKKEVEKSIAPEMSVLEFLKRIQRPRIRRRAVFDNHFLPQNAMVPEGAKVFCLEDGLKPVIAHIDDLVGVPEEAGTVAHLKRGGIKKPELTSEAREIVETIYAADYDRFGYERRSKGAVYAEAHRSPVGRIGIKLPIPNESRKTKWGDFYFANGFAKALRSQGWYVRLDMVDQWHRSSGPGEIDLVLRGYEPYSIRKDHPSVCWLISNPETLEAEELGQYDHVFVAGQNETNRLSNLGIPASLLMQAFDPDVMSPPAEDEATRKGVFFAGIHRKEGRPAVEYSVKAEMDDFELWGTGWGKGQTAPYFKGRRIKYSNTAEKYRAASVVLNDHTPTMRAAGLTSNRIFDALACAAPVVTDRCAWFPDDIEQQVYCFDDQNSFEAAIARAKSESREKKIERRAFANTMIDRHSFVARATQATPVLRKLVDQRAAEPKFEHLKEA